MEEKLRILMQNENLTATRLAGILEIRPAAVSHLLNGRNKPSYDLICKIALKFPRVNLRWLLGDEEQIYRDEPADEELGGLFSPVASRDIEQSAENEKSAFSNIPVTSNISGSAVEKIIIVYADKSFETLIPKC